MSDPSIAYEGEVYLSEFRDGAILNHVISARLVREAETVLGFFLGLDQIERDRAVNMIMGASMISAPPVAGTR